MNSQDPKISGIILAAGKAARMEKVKQLLPFRDGTILGQVVKNALGSSLHEVIVVLGYAAEDIRRVIDFDRARIVINADYISGQSTSLRAGLAAISDESDAAVFILGDQPLVGPDVIDALVKCYRQQGAPFIIPTYQGRRGNPVLIDRAVFPRLESLEGDVGARTLFDEYADQLHEIEMEDEHITFDVDTLDDYARLQEMEKGTRSKRENSQFLDISTADNKKLADLIVGIKGAGEMGSGIAWRLHQANICSLFMMEIPQPLAVRRGVSFCEALARGKMGVEGIEGVRANNMNDIPQAWARKQIPVIADPEWTIIGKLKPDVVVDAILAKRNLGTSMEEAPLVIALGPGFTAGRDAHMVIETNRGHNLGRILLSGEAEPNTGVPGDIGGYSNERVLRAPSDGLFASSLSIGDQVRRGDLIGSVDGNKVRAEIDGVVRGLIKSGIQVRTGLKLGDIDPRCDALYCSAISDKARAIGGAVLEAILRVYNR